MNRTECEESFAQISNGKGTKFYVLLYEWGGMWGNTKKIILEISEDGTDRIERFDITDCAGFLGEILQVFADRLD